MDVIKLCALCVLIVKERTAGSAGAYGMMMKMRRKLSLRNVRLYPPVLYR